MKLLFIILSFFLFPLLSLAQHKHDYIWMFGYEANNNGSTVDFNNNPVSVYFEEREMEIYTDNAMICNNEGELLFYTNGCYIADASHNMMMNGDSLNPGYVYDQYCNDGYPMSQGSIILPSPRVDEPDIYFLFHKASIIISEPQVDVLSNILYYSKIDMSLNNDLGAVIEKNQIIIEDSLIQGKLTAVKHENNIDWWIITPKYQSNIYLLFLLTSEGIQGPYNQSIGMETSGGGKVVFSPDGTKYVRYNKTEQVFLFDFDRSTGLLSNFQQFNVSDTANTGGCAVSSNSRYLYISSQIELYQFDLLADDILASKILVAEYDGYLSPFPTNFFLMQLAPDCRIYMNSSNGVDALHVINHPNEAGLACDVQQHAIQLPTYHQASLPNFPMYRLGTDYPICDTSFVVSTYAPIVEVEDFEVYPNPVKDKLRITTMHSQIELVEVFNSLGGKVFEQEGLNSSMMEFSLAEFSSGIYFVKIKANGKWMTKKVVVVK